MFFAFQAATAAICSPAEHQLHRLPVPGQLRRRGLVPPHWLTRRGHRLAFSNGIILLTALSLTLMLVVGATVDALIAFDAIGVFTGFAVAGFGMAEVPLRTREAGRAAAAGDQRRGRGHWGSVVRCSRWPSSPRARG